MIARMAATLWLVSGLAAAACELELLLTVDVSGSINEQEYRLQMDGLAAALDDGAIGDALVKAQAQVAVVQWSGSSRQEVSIPWRQMTSLQDVQALVAEIRRTERPWRHFSTAIGDMLARVGSLLDQVDCRQGVIDVSSDGISNEGVPPDEVRDALVVRGVRINAVVILGATEEDLAGYFREHVIGGLNSFVYEADNYEDYPRTIRRKLLDEITEPVS